MEQGFARAHVPHATWSEAVIVHFDSAQISLGTLIEVHLRTHASTSNHKMRGKYRSAIYAMSDDQLTQAQAIRDRLQLQFDAPLVTSVLSFAGFKPSDTRFHNYYANNSSRPFCVRYIDPKLDLIRRDYADLVQSETLET